MRIQNDILMALDKKSGVVLVLLDLSAAFDIVDHTLLLACLTSSGVIDVAGQWFESHLFKDQLLDELRRVQNAAAQVVVNASRYDQLTPILETLH